MARTFNGMNYYFWENEIGMRQAQAGRDMDRAMMMAAWLGKALGALRPSAGRRERRRAADTGGGRWFPPALSGGEPARG